MKRTEIILFGILAVAGLLGCQSARGPRFDARVTSPATFIALTNLAIVTPTNQLNADLLKPPADRFKLGPGDRLEIEILGEPTSRATTVVGPDGKIYFHLLAGLDVWGLSISEAKARIEQGMLNYMREKPQVSVILRRVESQRVWLLGRLATPGIYALTNGPMTLIEALALAGGPTSPTALASLRGGPATPSYSEDIADSHRSFVMRDGSVLPVDFYRLLKQGDMSQNIYLRPDDFVYLPSAMAREVFVLGAVNQPRSVVYRVPTSLVGAIAQAHGTVKDACLSRVAIVRGSLTEPRIAVVDYQDIVKGKAPDVLLEPGDIVYVPLTPYRTLVRYADLIVRTFVQTVAINEGSRAVSRNINPVGVNIGVGGSGPAVSPPP